MVPWILLYITLIVFSNAAPTVAPTNEPTSIDTPTSLPTEAPIVAPTESPTSAPTDVPSASPTESPTDVPTDVPSASPTEEPTNTPTEPPTDTPTSVVSSYTWIGGEGYFDNVSMWDPHGLPKIEAHIITPSSLVKLRSSGSVELMELSGSLSFDEGVKNEVFNVKQLNCVDRCKVDSDSSLINVQSFSAVDPASKSVIFKGVSLGNVYVNGTNGSKSIRLFDNINISNSMMKFDGSVFFSQEKSSLINCQDVTWEQTQYSNFQIYPTKFNCPWPTIGESLILVGTTQLPSFKLNFFDIKVEDDDFVGSLTTTGSVQCGDSTHFTLSVPFYVNHSSIIPYLYVQSELNIRSTLTVFKEFRCEGCNITMYADRDGAIVHTFQFEINEMKDWVLELLIDADNITELVGKEIEVFRFTGGSQMFTLPKDVIITSHPGYTGTVSIQINDTVTTLLMNITVIQPPPFVDPLFQYVKTVWFWPVVGVIVACCFIAIVLLVFCCWRRAFEVGDHVYTPLDDAYEFNE
eukprot:TRINITY_DN257_c0_g1_i1.p1 TRINITY_DN257_c0_g1~~TRINITY_DN257_c0_g1_i1.p1  ORF type:complete len:520 (+),score=103.10 TRINITY_DN257_c0_g1_i1:110-1669(+)